MTYPTVEPEDLVITEGQIHGLIEVDIIGRSMAEFVADLTARGWTVILDPEPWWQK